MHDVKEDILITLKDESDPISFIKNSIDPKISNLAKYVIRKESNCYNVILILF